MSSLTERLNRLRGHRPSIRTETANGSPGPEWSRYDEWAWERRIELPTILPKKFDTTFILPREFGSENLHFYDLETTGLSGGSGNTAFLIGIARQEEAHFEITQLFLADYPGEQALLRRYLELSPEEHPQISYNGLSFDYQVLRTRFAINRMPELHRKQIDLLYPTRRLWRTVLDNLTLETVERELLGIHRIGDLPGREAPDAWFAWLKGHSDRIQGVFQHNINDLVSLAKLLVLLEQCGFLGVEAAGTPLSERCSNRMGICRPNELSEEYHRSLSREIPLGYGPMVPRLSEWKMPLYWGIAHQWSLSDASKERSFLELGWAAKEARCGRELARHLKRERNYRASYSIWEELHECEKDFVSAIEQSKLLEHQMRNPKKALSVLDGLEKLAPSKRGREELARRKNRLNRKIARIR